jgi:hypothetical protein
VCQPCNWLEQANNLTEDIDWLLASGESPWQIAKRLNKTPAALSHHARRYGRPDLQVMFDTIAHCIGTEKQ